MSPGLTYLPAYIGLHAALVLAIACNAFLDIQYGSFGLEVTAWAIFFGITLGVGWRQQGVVSDNGRLWQKNMLMFGAILMLVVILPRWALPRAGLYLLAALQAACNCVVTTRRTLHFGLLVSAVMVMFATAHHRADWTMLFYLLPYLIVVVFTLVSEQISRRTQDIASAGMGRSMLGGQGLAITAATFSILFVAGLLYALTPQITRPYLMWRFGQPSDWILADASHHRITATAPGTGQSAGANPGNTPGQDGKSQGSTLTQDNGGGNGGTSAAAGTPGASGSQRMAVLVPDANGNVLMLGNGWPSPEQMRAAARRPGMPHWQASAITMAADFAERLDVTMTPLRTQIEQRLNDAWDWLSLHRRDLIDGLLVLIAAALLLATYLLLREARAGIWLLAHFDFLRLGLLRLHAPGNRGARQYFAAAQRLLQVHDLAPGKSDNTREYLARIEQRHAHLGSEAAELILIFERARYGRTTVNSADLQRMRELYLTIFGNAGKLTIQSR